jgi:hypothetical protein
MRAQHFYTTAINTLEDAAGRIFPYVTRRRLKVIKLHCSIALCGSVINAIDACGDRGDES